MDLAQFDRLSGIFPTLAPVRVSARVCAYSTEPLFPCQVVSEVKAKKMETMKCIKKLQVHRETLAKKQRQAKTDYDKVHRA